MSNTRFGIEWIYGEFLISRFAGGESVEQWSAPYPVTDLASLSRAMFDASQHIDLPRGGDVAIAYEDDLHTHEFLEVPPLGKRDLEKHLALRVEQGKPFEDEAAWCYHPAKPGQKMEGVLLHLMPRRIVEAVIRICGEYYLTPKRLVPLTEVISEHVPKLEADGRDVLLLIAMFAERVQLVVAHGDGEVLFVRELQYSWQNDNIDRLVVDVNRTIGYVKQRISLRPDHAWVMGEHARMVIDAFERDLDCPVSVDQSATGTDFWMAEVAGLPQRLDSNFIPRLSRRAVSRKSLMRAAVLTGFSLFGAAATMGAVVQWLIFNKALDAETIRADIVSLEQNILHMEEELRVFDLEQLRLNQLTADAFNLPALFLSHLGDMVPDGLVLLNANVVREDTHWTIELAGTTELPFDQAPSVFELLESRLTEPPWNAEINQSWRDTWMEQLKSGGAAMDGAVGFRITGRLR
jgi:hypothetical protein